MSAKHILLVDDDVEFAKMVEFLLESRDYKVHLAHTGAEAFDRVKRGPDLILLDCNLPDMDGFEVCSKLKSDPKTEKIPIIATTAAGMDDIEHRCLTAGADDCIRKPYEASDLLSKIRGILLIK